MTWANIRTRGLGKVKYRLSIDGWPDEWVTDSDLAGTASDGRERRAGLLYEGLVISERVDVRTGKIDVAGFTARIRSNNALAAFAKKPKVVAYLQGNVTASSTGWSTKSSALTNITVGNYYHAGSEAVKVTAKPGGVNITVTRQQWGTNAQAHYTETGFNNAVVPIWDGPPAMHGRRARLYAYGESESGASANGTQVWLGVVDGQPQLDPEDNLTWNIHIRPITDLLKQEVAPTSDKPMGIRGVYYAKNCPFSWRVVEFTVGSSTVQADTGWQYVTGHYESRQAFIEQLQDDINTQIASVLSMTELKVSLVNEGVLQFALKIGTVRDTYLYAYSPFDGYLNGSLDSWLDINGSTPNGGMQASAEYWAIMPGRVDLRGNVLQEPFCLLGKHSPSPWMPPSEAMSDNTSSAATDRLYLDSMSLSGISATDSVSFTQTDINGSPTVASAVVESVNSSNGFVSLDSSYWSQYVLNSQTQIKFMLDNSGSLYDFLNGIAGDSDEMNRGDIPALTSTDMDLTRIQTVVGELADHPFLSDRKWVFDKGQEVEEVVARELQLLGGVMRIESDGKIGMAKMIPAVDSQLQQLTLDGSNIVTPGGGGSWPSFVANAEGIVNVIRVGLSIQVPFPGTNIQITNPDVAVEIRNMLSIATHRNRGLGVQEIQPFSQPKTAMGLWEAHDFVVNGLVDRYWRLFSDTYYIVEVDVLLSNGTTSVFQNALIGDIARVTSPHIPDVSNGTMGITNKHAWIIGRSWNLDPANEGAPGRLTLMFRFSPYRGYAPSAQITAATNVSGNQWDLTVNDNDVAGNSMWPSGANLSDLFKTGYKIAAFESDVTAVNQEDGTVDSVTDPSTVRVTFDSTAPWGGSYSGTYFLRFKKASSSSDVVSGQEVYAYQADADIEMYDTSVEPVILL